jgi:hypothetical protein
VEKERPAMKPLWIFLWPILKRSGKYLRAALEGLAVIILYWVLFLIGAIWDFKPKEMAVKALFFFREFRSRTFKINNPVPAYNLKEFFNDYKKLFRYGQFWK